jgi:hypothetical protein
MDSKITKPIFFKFDTEIYGKGLRLSFIMDK